MRLENKVAVVTGAGSGIGKEIARLFVREGAKVVIADHNQERADEVAKELGAGRAIGIAVDVTDEAQVEACFAKTVALLGQVDILVSNAGIQSVAPIEEFHFGKWRQLLAVHLDGAFLRPGRHCGTCTRWVEGEASSTWALFTRKRRRC